jgi:hypothetical protein
VRSGVGGPTLNLAASASAPASVRFHTAVAPSGEPELSLTHRTGPTVVFSRAVLEADVMLDEIPATAQTIALIDLVLISGNASWHLQVHHSVSKVEVVEAHYGYADGGYGFVFNAAPPSVQLKKGAWTHLRVEVTAGTPSHGKVSEGVTTIFDADLTES